MKRINLHDYYPDLPADNFITVEDEIAAAMKPHSVEDATHARRMRRNKVISLDANDCIENHAIGAYALLHTAVIMQGHAVLCAASTQDHAAISLYLCVKVHFSEKLQALLYTLT